MVPTLFPVPLFFLLKATLQTKGVKWLHVTGWMSASKHGSWPGIVKGGSLQAHLDNPFNLQYHFAQFIVQTRVSKYPSNNLPWVTLQGWSVKLCSSVLSLLSICLTCSARNTINPSFDFACPFSFTRPSKGQSMHTPPWKSFPFLHCTSRVGDGMRCGSSQSHQEIQTGRIAKTNTPAEICVLVIFSVAHPLKIPKTCWTSSFWSRCYNSTASQEMIVTTIKPKLAGN